MDECIACVLLYVHAFAQLMVCLGWCNVCVRMCGGV